MVSMRTVARPSARHSAAGARGRRSGPMTVVGSFGVLLLLVVATEAQIGLGGLNFGLGAGGLGLGLGLGRDVTVGTGEGSAADPNVKVTLRNEVSERVRMVIGGGKGKVLECKQGGVAVLGPLYMSEAKQHVLKVVVFAHNSKGRLLTNKAIVHLNLRVVGVLVAGVSHVVLVLKVDARTKALVLTDAHSNVLVTLQCIKP